MGNPNANPNHRSLFNTLTKALLSARYVGDGHYLFLGEGADPRAIKITDYLANDLRICEDRAPDQKLRQGALERHEALIVIECGSNPTTDIYASGVPRTLRTDGLISGHLLNNMPPDWPENEPLTWAVKRAGEIGFVALEQPIQDPILLGIYNRLGAVGAGPA